MNEIKIIVENIRPENDFNNSENFIEDGLLDSFDIVSIVTEIETRYSITISGDDIVPENFITFYAITELVNKYV